MNKLRIKLPAVAAAILLAMGGIIGITITQAVKYSYDVQAKEAVMYEMQYFLYESSGSEEDGDESSDGTYFIMSDLEGNVFSNSTSIFYEDDYPETAVPNTAWSSKSEQYSYEKCEREILDYYRTEKCIPQRAYSVWKDGIYCCFVAFDFQGDRLFLYVDLTLFIEGFNSQYPIVIGVYASLSVLIVLICFIFGWNMDKSQESQRMFFQNASHELKTPLMSIEGYAEGINTGILDPSDASQVILDECEDMTSLVEELLIISRADSKKLELDLETADIRETVYGCAEVLQPVFRNKGIELKIDLPDDPVYMRYDEKQLKKVFYNVLSNDLRYAKSKVSVRAFIFGGAFNVKIADDGDGLGHEMTEHIFDRFYTGKDGRSGIGLSIAQEIVKLHHGTISVSSSESGTIFMTVIPTDL